MSYIILGCLYARNLLALPDCIQDTCISGNGHPAVTAQFHAIFELASRGSLDPLENSSYHSHKYLECNQVVPMDSWHWGTPKLYKTLDSSINGSWVMHPSLESIYSLYIDYHHSLCGLCGSYFYYPYSQGLTNIYSYYYHRFYMYNSYYIYG